MISFSERTLMLFVLLQSLCLAKTSNAVESPSDFRCLYYKLQTSIEPEQRSLRAETFLTLVCLVPKVDTIEFSLNENFPIQQISLNNIEPLSVDRRMTNDGESFYKLVSRITYVSGDTLVLSISYSGSLNATLEFGVISPQITELSGYINWFPYLSATDYSETKTDLSVTLPSKYEFTSNGFLVSDDRVGLTKTKCWHNENEFQFDFVIVTSDSMKLQQVSPHRFIFYSTETERQQLIKMITFSSECIYYYTTLYGPSKLKKDITIVSLPRNRPSTNAYYRSTLMVFLKSYLETDGGSWQFNKNLFHEIAHFFWIVTSSVRPPDSWIDEGLAEYSAWLAVDKIYGKDYFNKCLERATNIILKKPQVFLTHSAQDDYFYAFVPYIYHMLRFDLGDSLFLKMLKQLHPTIGTMGNLSAQAFVDTIQKFTPTNMDTFFDQWFSRNTFPILAYSWQQDSLDMSKVILKITQRQSQLFCTSVSVLLKFNSGDTEIRKVYINDRVTKTIISTNARVEDVEINEDKSIIAAVIRE